jgi:hypothetical protein
MNNLVDAGAQRARTSLTCPGLAQGEALHEREDELD